MRRAAARAAGAARRASSVKASSSPRRARSTSSASSGAAAGDAGTGAVRVFFRSRSPGAALQEGFEVLDRGIGPVVHPIAETLDLRALLVGQDRLNLRADRREEDGSIRMDLSELQGGRTDRRFVDRLREDRLVDSATGGGGGLHLRLDFCRMGLQDRLDPRLLVVGQVEGARDATEEPRPESRVRPLGKRAGRQPAGQKPAYRQRRYPHADEGGPSNSLNTHELLILVAPGPYGLCPLIRLNGAGDYEPCRRESRAYRRRDQMERAAGSAGATADLRRTRKARSLHYTGPVERRYVLKTPARAHAYRGDYDRELKD